MKNTATAKKDAQLLSAIRDLVRQDNPQNLRFDLERMLKIFVSTQAFRDLPDNERGDLVSSYVSLANFLFKVESGV